MAWLYPWFSGPVFSSTGRMIVSSKLQIQDGSVYTEEMANFIGTQAALMQSGTVLGRAQARVAAQMPDRSAMKIPVAFNITVIPKTTIFVLRATGEDPQHAQAFLQAAMEEYINLKKEMRANTSDMTFAGLTEEILRLGREARRAEDQLMSFQGSNSVVLVQDIYLRKSAVLAQKLIDLQTELELLPSQPQSEEKRNALGMQISLLERTLKESEARGLEINRKTAEWERLKSALQRIRALHERAVQTMQTLDLNKAIAQESVTILERASAAMPSGLPADNPTGVWSLLGLLISGLLLFTGHCLARRQYLSFCLVVAALESVLFPVGTVLGVLTLMVLWRDQPTGSPAPELPATP